MDRLAEDPRRRPDGWITASVDSTRGYDRFAAPDAHAQAKLESQVPLDARGRFVLHPEPVTVVDQINRGEVGPADGDLGRRNNCLGCSMAMVATWYGRPEVSAPLREGVTDGEPLDRAEQWAGAPSEYCGSGTAGLAKVEDRLRRAGPGSSALVGVQWEQDPETGHAFTAHVTPDGRLVWCDPQWGIASEQCPYGGADGEVRDVWAIELDERGRAR